MHRPDAVITVRTDQVRHIQKNTTKTYLSDELLAGYKGRGNQKYRTGKGLKYLTHNNTDRLGLVHKVTVKKGRKQQQKNVKCASYYDRQ